MFQLACFLLAVNNYLTVSDLPIKGTESDVAGMISATRSMKTVSESKTVMPGNGNIHYTSAPERHINSLASYVASRIKGQIKLADHILSNQGK